VSRLDIKLRLIGKKNQVFARFIVIPKRVKTKGPYKNVIGFLDLRKNINIRYVILNIYQIMLLFYFGGIPNKRTLCNLFYYFIDFNKGHNWSYFKVSSIKDFLKKKLELNMSKKKKISVLKKIKI
jgi:hypothetical protein